jgi:hypothetical protein
MVVPVFLNPGTLSPFFSSMLFRRHRSKLNPPLAGRSMEPVILPAPAEPPPRIKVTASRIATGRSEVRSKSKSLRGFHGAAGRERRGSGEWYLFDGWSSQLRRGGRGTPDLTCAPETMRERRGARLSPLPVPFLFFFPPLDGEFGVGLGKKKEATANVFFFPVPGFRFGECSADVDGLLHGGLLRLNNKDMKKK